MQTKPTVPDSATTASNVITFPVQRREPPRPLWASDLEMMEAYWRDMAEQFG